MPDQLFCREKTGLMQLRILSSWRNWDALLEYEKTTTVCVYLLN